MNPGDLVRTNLFGDENSWGILLSVRKLPKDSLEFFSCKVLFPGGKVRSMASSQLLTMGEVEEFGIS